MRKINEARKTLAIEREESMEENRGMQVAGEAKCAVQEMHDLQSNQPSDISDSMSLDERASMLNSDQRRIFEDVKSVLLHQKLHEEGKCSCGDLKPLRHFVSGVGGTGKSFLIEAMRALTNSLWPVEDLRCAVTAPTGSAAFNVLGTTLHRFFQLPVEHEGKEAGYWSLSKAAQKVLRTALRNLKFLVIDEISMVSSLNITYVHLRLQEIFGGDDWFGGINVLFVGDLLQLQPVNGNPVFQKMTKSTVVNKLGCAGSVNIWRDCVTYDELTINERQKKDERFTKILGSVREGKLTDDAMSALRERVIEVPLADKFAELRAQGKNPVCLLPTRKQCDAVNSEMLKRLDSEVHILPCCDVVDETKSTAKWQEKASKQLEKLNQDCNNTAGLEAVLKLAVGARVMLRRNIDMKNGLVNGAIGKVLGS